MVATLDEFQALGLLFVATNDQIDFSTAHGRLLMHILASLSEFEKSLLVERTKLGLAHAKSKGKVLGRARVHDYTKIRELRESGMTHREIQSTLKVSKGAIHRALTFSLLRSQTDPIPGDDRFRGKVSR